MNKVNITTVMPDGGRYSVLDITTTATVEEILSAFKNAQLNDCRFFLQTSSEVSGGAAIVTLNPKVYPNLELVVKPVAS